MENVEGYKPKLSFWERCYKGSRDWFDWDEDHTHQESKTQIKHNRDFWKRFLSEDDVERNLDDWEFARDMANMWHTCACGSFNDGIERASLSWQPRDAVLLYKGSQFAGAIEHRDMIHARILFREIQERARIVVNIDKSGNNK